MPYRFVQSKTLCFHRYAAPGREVRRAYASTTNVHFSWRERRARCLSARGFTWLLPGTPEHSNTRACASVRQHREGMTRAMDPRSRCSGRQHGRLDERRHRLRLVFDGTDGRLIRALAGAETQAAKQARENQKMLHGGVCWMGWKDGGRHTAAERPTIRDLRSVVRRLVIYTSPPAPRRRDAEVLHSFLRSRSVARRKCRAVPIFDARSFVLSPRSVPFRTCKSSVSTSAALA